MLCDYRHQPGATPPAAFSQGKLLSASSLEDVMPVVGLGTGVQLPHTAFMVVSLMGWRVGRARVNG